MANRYELIDNVLNKLFSLADKSREKYNEVLDIFELKTLDQIQNLDEKRLKLMYDKINKLLKTGSNGMGKVYDGKDFDKEVDTLFFRNAVKLAQETDDEEKKKETKPQPEPEQQEQKQPEPEQQEEQTQPEQQSEQQDTNQEENNEEAQESQKIEDIVKDLQVSILEKVNDVKGFKPGRSEAINFRNSLDELIKVSESAVKTINDYYQKALGNAPEESKDTKE